MDIRYANALRNATNAWAKNRTVDMLTLEDLKRRRPDGLEDTQVVQATDAAQNTQMQPPLARYGNLGTRLNLFA